MTKLAPCKHGHFLFNPTDEYVGRSLDKYGEFSEGEVQTLLSLIDQDSVVLDIGANIGCLTVPLSQKARFVIAVEPQRVTFQHLCANVALSGQRNVQASQSAVSDIPGTMKILQPDFDCAQNNGGYALVEGDQGEMTRVITIDGMSLPKCDLIKIDVEGMESRVIDGAAQTIERFKPVLYVEADRDDKAPELIEQITGMGYACWWHLPPLFNELNHAGNAENLFPGIVSINLLCLPDKREVDADLYEALPGDSFEKLKARFRT